MKKLTRALAALLAFTLLAVPGCAPRREKAPVEVTPTSPPKSLTSRPAAHHPTPRPVPTPTPEPPDLNLLTGVPGLTPEAIGQRPVAITLGNSLDALPQAGISEADIIFELPVEGGVTRLMALYGDYTQVPEAYPVRSCRAYFPILAAGYDAHYVHWGQDPTAAAEVLSTLDISHLDGEAGTYGLFTRSQARAAQGFAQEHTGAFLGPQLAKALGENGVRTQLPVHKNEPFFDFARRPQAPPQACSAPRVSFSASYYSDFEYNEQSKVYYKSHSGADHRDQHTGKRLAFTNLFLLETETSVHDQVGRLDIAWQEGSGWYVSLGGACPITWEKDDEYSNLVFYNESGARLRVNPGRSYISLCQTGCTSLG